MTTIATMNDFDFEAFALDYVCCDYGPCELCFKKTKDAELDKYDNGLCRSCFYKTKDIRKELYDSEGDVRFGVQSM